MSTWKLRRDTFECVCSQCSLFLLKLSSQDSGITKYVDFVDEKSVEAGDDDLQSFEEWKKKQIQSKVI